MVTALKIAGFIFWPFSFSKTCEVPYCVTYVKSIVSIWISHKFLTLFHRWKFAEYEETFTATVAGIPVELQPYIVRIITEFLYGIAECIII